MTKPCPVLADAVGAAVSRAIQGSPGEVIIAEPTATGFLVTAASGLTDSMEVVFCSDAVRSKSLTSTIDKH